MRKSLYVIHMMITCAIWNKNVFAGIKAEMLNSTRPYRRMPSKFRPLLNIQQKSCGRTLSTTHFIVRVHYRKQIIGTLLLHKMAGKKSAINKCNSGRFRGISHGSEFVLLAV